MEQIKEELIGQLNNRILFTIPLPGGGGIPVSESVVVSWIVMAALVLAALVLTRNLRVERPGRIQCCSPSI